MEHNEKIASRPRLLKELAEYYKVSTKTMKKWLSCNTLSSVVPEIGNFYSIRQVKEIINHLGENDG